MRLNGTIAHVRCCIAYPLSQGNEPIGSIWVASDIVTVRECVGVAFSFAEEVEQSVFLRWDRLAVSLSRWCHYQPLAVASFGGGILTAQWLRWPSQRANSAVGRRPQPDAQDHMVVAAYQGGDWLILDNRTLALATDVKARGPRGAARWLFLTCADPSAGSFVGLAASCRDGRRPQSADLKQPRHVITQWLFKVPQVRGKSHPQALR